MEKSEKRGVQAAIKVSKRRALYDRYHPTFPDFQAAIPEFLDAMPTKDSQQPASLVTLSFRQFDDVSLMPALGWVGVTHVRRYHEHYHCRGAGHLYQGDSRAFPWQRTMTSSCSADTSRPTRCAPDWCNVLSNGDGANCGGAPITATTWSSARGPWSAPGSGEPWSMPACRRKSCERCGNAWDGATHWEQHNGCWRPPRG